MVEEAANREHDKILNKAFQNNDYCTQYLIYVPCFQIVTSGCLWPINIFAICSIQDWDSWNHMAASEYLENVSN